MTMLEARDGVAARVHGCGSQVLETRVPSSLSDLTENGSKVEIIIQLLGG
jgi:hypothetical protein